MGDTVIVTETEAKPAPDVVVLVPQPKSEKVVTEKTVIKETKVE